MASRKRALILLIACLVVRPGMSAFGEEATSTAPTSMPDSTATKPDEAPARAPLMDGLDKLGVAKPLDDLNINLFGYVQAGYFYDTSLPKVGQGPTYIGFNGFKNSPVVDKVDMALERTIDPTKKEFDLGFHAEGIFGADAQFIHSNGMSDLQTGRYQWDCVQAYVDVAVPGLPMRIRVGKWIELAGFEQFSANIYGAFGDPSKGLYSYSYQFLFAEPGTQTGVLATYVLSPELTLDAGFTRGWNQSINDNNSALDFLGRATWTPSDKTSVIFVMTEGPEFPATVGHTRPTVITRTIGPLWIWS